MHLRERACSEMRTGVLGVKLKSAAWLAPIGILMLTSGVIVFAVWRNRKWDRIHIEASTHTDTHTHTDTGLAGGWAGRDALVMNGGMIDDR